MCGIVGFNWQDAKLIKQMMKEISHRGPDDSGFYLDKHFSLGHQRLSILDLSKKGHQPMFNENQDIVLVFNGEIYNFPSLRKELEEKGHKFISNSDTEVIIHGYEEYGEAIPNYLEGMFALALYDIKKRKLILARDHIGEKPLYYYFNKKDGKLIFASEIKAILLADVKRKINFQCLSDYLSLRYSPDGITMFDGIKKLEPGDYLVYNLSEKGKIKIKKFWNFPEFSSKIKPDTKILDNLIKEAIKKRLMSDVPLGVFLSGGLDSSTLVAYLSKLREANIIDKIKTFSIGFNDSTDETKYARIIAEKFNTEHKEIISSKNIFHFLPKVIWHLDEPLADPAILPTYVLSKEVSKYVKVALAGEGGDEVFGGYQAFNYINYLKIIKKFPGFFRKKLASKSLLLISDFFKYPNKQVLKLSSEILEESDDLKKSFRKMCYFPFEEKDKEKILKKKNINFQPVIDTYLAKNKDVKNAALEYYFKELMPNDFLVKADKIGMANALEIRVPYLDLSLIKYSASLDNKYKQNRALFRQTVKKFLPKEIMKKKKQGFTLPISNWFCKKDFNAMLMPHFLDLSKRKIFDDKELKKIILNPTSFRNDHRLWTLLNFELWCKIYLDNIPYEKIKL